MALERRRRSPYTAALHRLRTKNIRRVWIVGQAACGKSYIAEKLAVDLGFAIVRTRDFVQRWALDRNIAEGKIASFLENVYQTGSKPVLDSINKYVTRRLLVAARNDGIIIDSAPRTVEQVPVVAEFDHSGIVHVFSSIEADAEFLAKRVSTKGELEQARISRARVLFPPIPNLPVFTELDNEYEL